VRRLRLLGTSSAILEDARRVGFEHHARPVAAPVYTFHDVELLLFLDLGAYASKDAIGLEQTHLRLLESLHPFQMQTDPLTGALSKMRQYYDTGATRLYSFRRQQLLI
jgi:hypothetical protein